MKQMNKYAPTGIFESESVAGLFSVYESYVPFIPPNITPAGSNVPSCQLSSQAVGHRWKHQWKESPCRMKWSSEN